MIYWIIPVVLLVIIGIVAIIVYRNYQSKKRKNDIFKIFWRACQEKEIENYKLEYVKKDTYDFYFESEKNIYYIKVIYNFSNQEICINNAIKWQLRGFKDNNEGMQFVEGIESLMRLDLNN